MTEEEPMGFEFGRMPELSMVLGIASIVLYLAGCAWVWSRACWDWDSSPVECG